MNTSYQLALERRIQAEEFRRRHRTELFTMVFTDIVGSPVALS